MTALNSASAVRLGAQAVSRVYAGATLVWPPFSPAVLPGLLAWYDASQLGLADGGAVASLPDLSGNARAAVQATSSLQPLCKTNILGGKPVLRFDGVDDNMLTPAFSWPAEHSVVMLYRCNLATIPTGQGIANAGSNPLRMFQLRQLNVTTAESAGFNTANASFVDDMAGATQTWLRHSYIRTVTNLETFINGASDGPTVTSGTAIAVSVGLYLGAANFNLKPGAIDLAELVAYDHALSSTERQQLESYLAAKWLG